MNTLKAQQMLRDTLDENGLEHVRAELNGRLTSVFGRYRYGLSGKRVELSVKLVEINDEDRVKLVILHEVAHALTEGHGHNAIWQKMCLALGGDGERYYSRANTNTLERRRSSKIYQLKCDDCGYAGGRYRRKMNGYRHRSCGGDMTSIELQ